MSTGSENDSISFDLQVVAFSIGSIVLYHVYFYSCFCCCLSNRVQLSTNIKNSVFWMKKHQSKGDAPSVTLAIHTLRNIIMVAIFTGGYALNLGVSISNAYPTHSTAEDIRCLVIAVFSIGSFLAWATVIRIAAQLGFLMGTLAEDAAKRNDQFICSVSGTTTGDVESFVSSPSDKFGSDIDEDEQRKPWLRNFYSSFRSFRPVPIEESLVAQPPDIPRESERMLHRLLLAFKYVILIHLIPYAHIYAL